MASCVANLTSLDMKSLPRLISICVLTLLTLWSASQAQTISAKTTLSITIKGVPQAEQTRISGQYVVSPSGHIFLPLLKTYLESELQHHIVQYLLYA